MTKKGSFTVIIILLLLSCNEPAKNNSDKIYTSNEMQAKIEKAKAGSIALKGRFDKISKLNDRDYILQLKLNADSVVSLITMMPLGEEEISRLKKEGDNIEIYYQEEYNPVKKRKDKIVTFTNFIYEPEKK